MSTDPRSDIDLSWYNLAFKYVKQISPKRAQSGHAAYTLGTQNNKGITQKDVKDACISLDIPVTSVLIACTFLGVMTYDEFYEGCEEPDT